MRKIYWLASFPKSGNTWVRVFLNNYWWNGDEPVHINQLGETPALYVRDFFDDIIHVESGLLTYDEIDRLRPDFHRLYAQTVVDMNGQFCKVHDAYERLPDGTPIFPPDASGGAVYILRNPLDVAISYAHHNVITIDDAIERMENPEDALSSVPTTQSHQLRQYLRTWSQHVESWTTQRDMPLQIVRYEDMLTQPMETFGAIIRFIGWQYDAARLEKAIRFSSFDELKAQEKKHGFHEKPISAESFFRKGQAGDWRNTLTPEQVERIVNAHRTVMERFGYLP